jgi:hypothetical protein
MPRRKAPRGIMITAAGRNPTWVGEPPPGRKLGKKPGTPERDYQMTQVDYLERQFPHWVVAAVVNEAAAKSKNPISMARYYDKRRKAGVKEGFPDIVCYGPYPLCILIENKSLTGDVRQNQKELHDKLGRLGWEVHVSRTLDDLQAMLRKRGLLR